MTDPRNFPDVILLADQQFDVGEVARLFHSVTFGVDGRMHLLCRHEKMRDENLCQDPNAFSSQTEHSTYEIGDAPRLTARKIIDTHGEETRTWQQPDGTPWAFYMHTHTGQMAGYDFNVANLDSGEIHTINFPDGKSFPIGKNWSPFALDDRIGFIHGTNPLRILATEASNGATHEHFVAPEYTWTSSQHDKFNIFRGGTNGVPNENGWEGYGHTTSESFYHIPYHWRLTRDWQFSLTFDQDFSPLLRMGFSILDPTCYFDDPDGNRWLGICASERTWFWGQYVLSMLWPIEIKNPDGKFLRAMAPFRCAKADLPQGISIYPSQHTAPAVSGVRGSTGVILGHPTLFVSKPTRFTGTQYTCDFYYRAHADTSVEVANVPIYICEGLNPTQMVMALPLMGTEGKVQRVTFDLPALPGDCDVMAMCHYRWNAPLEFFHLMFREQKSDWPRKTLYQDAH